MIANHFLRHVTYELRDADAVDGQGCFPSFYVGDVQEIFDQALELIGLAHDRAHYFNRFIGRDHIGALSEGPRKSLDDRKRGAKLMSDHSNKVALHLKNFAL
jgi:hypothetical protein